MNEAVEQIRSPRASSRRKVLKVVSEVRRATSWIQGRWTASGRIYDGEMGGRVRELHEYPENSVTEWTTLADYIGEITQALTALQQYARDEAGGIAGHDAPLTPAARTIVEVRTGDDSFQYAMVVDQPEDHVAPNWDEAFVWVRYDNGCVVPKREYYIRALTPDQVVAALNNR